MLKLPIKPVYLKKGAAALLCAAVLLSSNSGMAGAETPSNSAGSPAAGNSDGSVNVGGHAADGNGSDGSNSDNAAADNGGGIVRHVTEREALSSMKEYASNPSFSLLVNEDTGTFAVRDLSDGSLIWSNPYDADGDEYIVSGSKRDELKSALIINAVKVSDSDAASTVIRSADSTTGASTEIQKIDGGFKAVASFPIQGIKVPYYVTLKDDCFEISVAVNEIFETEFDDPENIEDSTASIVDLNLFPNLYAAYSDENGYFVIPDGSGAIINFNNGKQRCAEYSQKIYGRDYSKVLDSAPPKTEQAYFPMLGMVKDDGAVLEVVTEGAAYATVKASVAGQRATGYNAGGFEFSLRTTDQYFMGAVNASALRAYEQNRIPEDRITVRYYHIAKKNASYMDIAERYRQYLLDEGLMTRKTIDGVPLYIDLYGGTVKEQSVMGFPVKLKTAATDYGQAKTILEELKERGADDIIVTYNEFNEAGITDRISSSVDCAGKLGGKAAFGKLLEYCENEGILLAPSADLMEFSRSGSGFSKTGDSVIGVAKSYSTQGEFELAFGTPHPTRRAHFILAPARFEDAYGSFVSDISAVGAAAVSTADSASILYGDFRQSENRYTSRQQTVEILKSCWEQIGGSGLAFVTSACNDYALKYADYIRNVPLSSSGFDITDYDIPLYEIIIHGYIPYTTRAINASSAADEALLKSLVTGTPPHYDLMYENPNKFTDSDYDTLFYTHSEGYLDSAAKTYSFFKENLSDVIDRSVAEFEIVSDSVWRSKFDNGTVIEADFENYTVTINGKLTDLPNKSWKGAAE